MFDGSIVLTWPPTTTVAVSLSLAPFLLWCFFCIYALSADFLDRQDTVVDAGMFDGALGIVSAISAIKVMNVTGKLRQLRHPVEVIEFTDEEGVRFQYTFLGSAAIAGVLPISVLQIPDKRNSIKQWFDSAKCFKGKLDRQ